MDLNSELSGSPRVAGHDVRPANDVAPIGALAREIEQSDWRLQAQDEERLRLGRELHDSTGQLLLALRLGIARLKLVHGTCDEDEALSEIEDTALRIDKEIRSFAFSNYPATVGHEGLSAALNYLARGFGVRTGLCIKLNDRSRGCMADGPVAVALLRVAQEALTNVHRHAGAAHVRINLAADESGIELSVRDDGRGIAPEYESGAVSGVGLQGMRHRIERLGGLFSIRRLKHGTRIVARVPFPA
jgi:signal transduction histidine kinase